MHENRSLNCYISNNLGAVGVTTPTEVSPAAEHALELALPVYTC